MSWHKAAVAAGARRAHGGRGEPLRPHLRGLGTGLQRHARSMPVRRGQATSVALTLDEQPVKSRRCKHHEDAGKGNVREKMPPHTDAHETGQPSYHKARNDEWCA